MITPTTGLSELIKEIILFKVDIRKVNKILNATDEVDRHIDLENFENKVKFNNVTFSYNNSNHALSNINLIVRKGDKVGIYGKSAEGKTTLISLLMRFFEISDGDITIDGINIKDITKSFLRKVIGVITQNVQLFDDTIKNNIVYGINNYTEEQLIYVCKQANCYDFIINTVNSFDSLVGNNGIKLSGGERQRIALARLFLVNPQILILDEATSSLDNESERLIKDAIDNISQDRTVISIAHRLTTIKDMDYLVGLKNHTVYESGKFKDLIRNKNTLCYELFGENNG